MSRVRLGELLLARGLCTREQLAQALEQQVVYGDRLGTNLMALGVVDEEALAGALGTQHGVHAGYGSVLHVDPDAVATVSKALAIKHALVPHHIADRTLYLLMQDPNDLQAVDDVRFATRLKVQPVVVCEARLWRLLLEHYGHKSSLRPNPVDVVKRAVFAAAEPTAPVAVEDLVSEEEFHQLYAKVALARSDAAADEAPDASEPIADLEPEPDPEADLFGDNADDADGVPDWTDTTQPDRMRLIPGRALSADQGDVDDEAAVPAIEAESTAGVDWVRGLEDTNPMPALPKGLPEAPGEVQLVEVASEPESLPPGDPTPAEVLSAPPATTNPAPATVLSPLSFEEAAELLTGASSRDDIARVVLRAARAQFARACLITVYHHAFVGWQGVGDGFDSATLVDVSLARELPSVFALVADSRAYYLGPLQPFTANGVWVKATGKKIPKSVAVLPILVRGRVVNLLVVDNGHDQHVGSDVGGLLILAQRIAGTYEQLLQGAPS